MTSAHPDIPPQPAVCSLSLNCQSSVPGDGPAYNATVNSDESIEAAFCPWTVSGLGPFPTSITLIATARLTGGQTPTPVPVSVSVEVSGSTYSGFIDSPTPVALVNLNETRSGTEMVQATIEINLTDYGATAVSAGPDTTVWIMADVKASAEAQDTVGANIKIGLFTGPEVL